MGNRGLTYHNHMEFESLCLVTSLDTDFPRTNYKVHKKQLTNSKKKIANRQMGFMGLQS